MRFVVDGRRIDVDISGALADGEYIESMALLIDDKPIVSVPFHMHGTTLHTVCRENGEVDTIEW